MGYGAFLKVVNNRSGAISSFVTGVDCMYDNGDQGSNLSLFNNADIAGNASLPANGGQYIEAKASGSCFFRPSTFSLKIENADNHDIIGQVDFSESENNWSCTNNDNKDVLDVYLNNNDQAHIQLTVEAT